MDMGSGGSAYKGVLVNVDHGQLLSLDLIKELEDFQSTGTDERVFMACAGASVVWSNPKHVFDGGLQLLFALDAEERKPPTVTRNATPQLERHVSWSCAERYRGLRGVPRAARRRPDAPRRRHRDAREAREYVQDRVHDAAAHAVRQDPGDSVETEESAADGRVGGQ